MVLSHDIENFMYPEYAEVPQPLDLMYLMPAYNRYN